MLATSVLGHRQNASYPLGLPDTPPQLVVAEVSGRLRDPLSVRRQGLTATQLCSAASRSPCDSSPVRSAPASQWHAPTGRRLASPYPIGMASPSTRRRLPRREASGTRRRGFRQRQPGFGRRQHCGRGTRLRATNPWGPCWLWTDRAWLRQPMGPRDARRNRRRSTQRPAPGMCCRSRRGNAACMTPASLPRESDRACPHQAPDLCPNPAPCSWSARASSVSPWRPVAGGGATPDARSAVARHMTADAVRLGQDREDRTTVPSQRLAQIPTQEAQSRPPADR